MLALTREGRRACTAKRGTGNAFSHRLMAQKLIAVIPISGRTGRSIALPVDDRLAFTADQTEPRLSVVDTEGNIVKTGSRCLRSLLEPLQLLRRAGCRHDSKATKLGQSI